MAERTVRFFEITDEHGQVVLRLPIQNPHNKRLTASRAR